MPLAPQITITPVPVTSSGMTVVSVIAGGVPATFEQLAAVDVDAQQALADAAAAQADATTAIADASAALAQASSAYATAVIANTTANTAQATANGKNKVTYSTGTPGTTANTAGDIWFQYGTSGPNAGRIIAQYTGNGGTSWTQTTVSGLVIANIDAGSITTGTLAVGIAVTGVNGSFTLNAVTGVLTATGVNVTGTVTATTGTFTGTVIATTGSFTGTVITPNATITGGSLTLGTSTVTTTINSSGTINIVDSSTGLLTSAGVSLTSTGNNTKSFISTAGFYAGSTSVTNFALDTLNELGSYSGIPRLYAPAGTTLRLVSDAGLLRTAYPISMEAAVNIFGRLEVYGNLNAPNIPSTTSTANVRWTTGGTGQFQYNSASSERFKENITDIGNIPGLDPKALLDIPVRAFSYKSDYLSDNDDRYGVMVPGFIAEEVDAVYPVAVDYEVDGPVTWNERFIVPAMLSLIQDLYKEIDKLKGE
jgi:hypothetical protein